MRKKRKYNLVDYIFWFFFILMTNPGGILQALGEDTSQVGKIDVRDVIFVVLFGCYVLVYKKGRIKDKTYRSITKILIIFGLYYLIVYGFLTPSFKEVPGYSVFQFVKKSRKTIYSLLLFVMVYKFYIRSYAIFFKYLVISSIIVLGLFFVTFITGFKILPISTHNRGFIDVDRVFLAGEGLMALLIPIGTFVIVFKSKIKFRKLILIASSMMVFSYILSITRRDIIGVVIIFLITTIFYNYLRKMNLFPVKKLLSISVYMLFFSLIVSFTFPKYIEAGIAGVEEAIHIVRYGETSSGRKDSRMGLGKEFMQNLILNNKYFGTGFDNRWRGTGDKEGFETSDYPFLSAIAMMGIFGILIFLPVYIILFRALINDIRFLRRNIMNFQTIEFHIISFFIIYFIYNSMQYMNWFLPVSLSRSPRWYIYLAMYMASRQIFYAEYFKNLALNRLQNG